MHIYNLQFIFIFFIQVVFSNNQVKFNNPDSLIIYQTLDSLLDQHKYSNMQYQLSSYDENIKNISYTLSHVQENIDTIIIKSKTKIKHKYLKHIKDDVKNLSIDKNFEFFIERKKQKMVSKYYFIKKKPFVDIGILSEGEIGMLIDLVPDFNNFFSGVFGGSKSYGNDWNLNGAVDSQFENLWGAMERITFKWKNIDSTNQSFKISLHRPHLLITGIGLKGEYNYQIVNNYFTETQFGINIEFFNNYYGSLYVGYQQGDITSTEQGLRKNYFSTNYKALKFVFEHNSFNRVLLPDKGQKLDIEFDIGEDKFINELYLKTKLNFIGFSNFFHKINFCLKSYNDLIKPFQGEIGLSRQISFGGVNSLRGFNDNQFKSSSLSIQSLEIHYTLDNSFKAITFIDCSFAKNYYPKYSFGFGLNKISKKALVEVQYAVPLGSAFQNGKVHLKWVTRL